MSEKEEKFVPKQWHVTKMFRGAYMALFKPTEYKTGDGKAMFRVTMLFPKDSPGHKHLKDIYDAEIKSKFPDGKLPRGFKYPFGDGDEVDWGGHSGCVYIRATTKFDPGIIDYDPDRKGERIVDPTEVYNGCYCRAVVQFWTYDKEGGKGAGFNFKSIQKIKDGERLQDGSDGTELFDAEDAEIDPDDPSFYKKDPLD